MIENIKSNLKKKISDIQKSSLQTVVFGPVILHKAHTKPVEWYFRKWFTCFLAVFCVPD